MNKLTKAEEQIMHRVWKLKEATVTQIINDIGDQSIPHSSISSIVRILEKKAFVGHKSIGRTYVYFPLIKKSEYSKSTIKDLVSNYFGGSVENLVSFLVNEKEINKKELLQFIEEQDRKTKS